MKEDIRKSLVAGVLGFSLVITNSTPFVQAVTLSEASVSKVSLDKSYLVLNVGESARVNIKLSPSKVSFSEIQCSATSDVSLAVDKDKDGKPYLTVTARHIGATTVLVIVDGCSAQLPVTIGGESVTKRTQKQIRSFIKKHAFSLQDKITYKTKPSTKVPYSVGAVSTKTQKSALNFINSIRYIAGLDSNVTLSKEYSNYAQTGALVNAINDVMSHYPTQPAGMSDDLFATASKGTSQSNLAVGYSNLNLSILNGWMNDSNASNIDHVGHRRWILNPSMKETGFGAAGNYRTMYAFDQSGSGLQTGIYWPAQTMPIEYFSNDEAWSVSLGQNVDISKVKVQLTRVADSKKWTFSSKKSVTAKSSGYFNVNNEFYGLPGCIIFRPNNISYKKTDQFRVKITGTPIGTISYKVSFFSL